MLRIEKKKSSIQFFFQIYQIFIFYQYCNYKQIGWQYTGNAFLGLQVPVFKTVYT